MTDMLFFWIFLYGLVLAGKTVLADSWAQSCLLSAYTVAFVCWIWKTGRQKEAHLDLSAWGEKKNGWHLLPLLLFPVYNLVFAMEAFPRGSVWPEMLSVSLVEEIFFRGFLLRRLGKRGPLWGILGTSLVFSLLHLANLFPAGDGIFVLVQVLGSFFVSICYCGVTILWGNLLPCAAAHFLTNVFGTGVLTSVPALMCCIALYAIWGGLLCLKITKQKGNPVLY